MTFRLVVDCYVQMLKRREYDYTLSITLVPPCKKFFFSFSYFICVADTHIKDVEMHVSCRTLKELASLEHFYTTYGKQDCGPDMVDFDYDFFPTCTGSHWILFIVDLRKRKVNLTDPLQDEINCNFQVT